MTKKWRNNNFWVHKRIYFVYFCFIDFIKKAKKYVYLIPISSLSLV